MIRSRLGWASACALLLSQAQCSTPRTELVVTVRTDLAWGAGRDVQSLRVTVRRGDADGATRWQQSKVLGSESGQWHLPLSFGLYPSDASDITPLWIEVLACPTRDECSASTALVTQRAIVSYRQEQIVGLDMWLAGRCRGVVCSASQTCGLTTGTCVEARSRDGELYALPNGVAPTAVDAALPPSDATTPDADAALPDRTLPEEDALAPDVGTDAAIDVRPDMTAPDVVTEVAPDLPLADVASDVVTGPVTAPRPIAPLSTATVTRRQPVLHWQLAAGSDGARVEICSDRACTMIEQRIDRVGDRVMSSTDLTPGVHFWRMFGRSGATVGTIPSPTWEFFVGRRSAPVDTSWGTVADFNGDGFADLVVGADGASDRTGRVLVYFGSATGHLTSPSVSLTGPDGMDGVFGLSVASAGDVNGDGYADLVVGAARASGQAGRAHVYWGSAMGLPTSPSVSLTGPDGIGGNFGLSVASAGDVNGDGYADVVVGAYHVSSSIGRAHIYFGSATGLLTRPSISLSGPDGTESEFGRSAASAGDVNGDGFADLVVGADGASDRTGRVHVYFGSATGPPISPSVSLTGPDGANGNFGFSVASASDVNGDGYADLAVGAIFSTSAAATSGRAYVYFGNATGLPTRPSINLIGPDGAGDNFGDSVANSGDVNGDGYADLVVGASRASESSGRAHVYFGSSTGLPTSPSVSLMGPDDRGDQFGASVAGAGDVNGDGYPDLVVGAPYANGNTGRVHVYFGRATGLPTSPSVSLTGLDRGGFFGISVARSNVRSTSRHSPDCDAATPESVTQVSGLKCYRRFRLHPPTPA